VPSIRGGGYAAVPPVEFDDCIDGFRRASGLVGGEGEKHRRSAAVEVELSVTPLTTAEHAA